jgi:predicted nucleic acid-binding protein
MQAIVEERDNFDLPAWLRSREPEPVAVSAITFSELWFGIEVEDLLTKLVIEAGLSHSH